MCNRFFHQDARPERRTTLFVIPCSPSAGEESLLAFFRLTRSYLDMLAVSFFGDNRHYDTDNRIVSTTR
jgi:hypothetical protein